MTRQGRPVLGLWLALLMLCAPHLSGIQPSAVIAGMMICRAGPGPTPAPAHRDHDCPACVLCAAAADLALAAGPSALPPPRPSRAADAGWHAASSAAPAVAPVPAARGPPLA